MLKGRALHTLVLEGEEAFGKAFAEEPSPTAYPRLPNHARRSLSENGLRPS